MIWQQYFIYCLNVLVFSSKSIFITFKGKQVNKYSYLLVLLWVRCLQPLIQSPFLQCRPMKVSWKLGILHLNLILNLHTFSEVKIHSLEITYISSACCQSEAFPDKWQLNLLVLVLANLVSPVQVTWQVMLWITQTESDVTLSGISWTSSQRVTQSRLNLNFH